ncbi:MAG: histidine phosphatase family protein [Anaerolineales bacterium]|nr:histidine phosphatase family protein [Anaerolineales bacterium]
MSTIIHVVRHGRIPNYDADQSLTAQGREESLAVGRGLAALIKPGETVRFCSSPVRRARETAALLCQSVAAALAETRTDATLITPIAVDDRLQNNQFYLNGSGYDPMLPLLDVARWRVQTTPSPENQAFLTYQTEFWTAPDPVTYWLTHPSPLAESTEAVVERLQACLKERLAGQGLGREICVTHSANIRAFLRQVFGHDPGPPAFSGMLTLSDGQVDYQGQVANFSL